MNIWQFQSVLTRRLLIWSIFSMVIGGLLQIPRDRFARGVGQQFTAWGLIDALIAIIGQRASQKRRAQLVDPLANKVTAREARNLSKLLWINTGLDTGYVAGGAALAFTKRKSNSTWYGHGIGVIIQGVFLFFFDLLHALRLQNKTQSCNGAKV